LNPGSHREIHKKRPAVIISHPLIHEHSFSVIVIPISSQVPKIAGPEMVIVGKQEGLEKQSVILPIFIRSIDQKRLIKRIGKVDAKTMKELVKAIKVILDLP
jgi:mRNA interferase MazF